MAETLVQRLRAFTLDRRWVRMPDDEPRTILTNPDGPEAAAEIERLTAEVEWLRTTLQKYAETFCELGPYTEACGKLTEQDCSGCLARQALANKEPFP